MGPQSCTVKANVPVLFHEPYVEKGFRPMNQPWKNYILSLFQWHNEVMNTWTHLIAFFMVLFRAGIWWTEFALISDPYMWPLAAGIVTMLMLYLCSTGAHWLSNRSELVHYTCFMIDYAGIGLYGFGGTMLHYWYCLHEDFLGTLSHQLAIPVGAILAVITCICCSISKTRYKRPYPFTRRIWQMSSVLSIYVWLNLPIWYKLGLYLYDGVWESSFGHHIKQVLWFTLGGFFFGSDIPQRFFPGRFDLIGHSHQIFHVCVIFTTIKQMDALYLEITDGIQFVRRMEAPTFMGTWGALLFVIIANTIVVLVFHRSVRLKLLAEGKENEKNGCFKHYCIHDDSLQNGRSNNMNVINSNSLNDEQNGVRNRSNIQSSMKSGGIRD